MNSQRRKAIDAILKDLEKLQQAIEGLPGTDDIKASIEGLAEEEREYHDNMHENLQGGERGQAAEEAANSLEEAVSDMDELGIDDLAGKIGDVIDKLEAARDGG